jgi:multidrug resistance efflux pump
MKTLVIIIIFMNISLTHADDVASRFLIESKTLLDHNREQNKGVTNLDHYRQEIFNLMDSLVEKGHLSKEKRDTFKQRFDQLRADYEASSDQREEILNDQFNELFNQLVK